MTRPITAAEVRALLPKQNKYRAKPTVIDGIRFPSKAEANRWTQLRLLQMAGAISNLKRQVRFPLHVNGELVCTYIADFTYQQDGKEVVEDKKGCVTKEYALKRKLFAAIHGARIVET